MCQLVILLIILLTINFFFLFFRNIISTFKIMTNYFSNETISYLEHSFLKVLYFFIIKFFTKKFFFKIIQKINGFEPGDLTQIFGWLVRVPKYTTIRINRLFDCDESLNELQTFVDNAYAFKLNNNVPRLELVKLIDECVVFKSFSSNLIEPILEVS
jgi:hypothetical protein